jgi:predicted nucleic acid-binding protein
MRSNPGEELRESAKRLLRVHDLRTADALQLAAAVFIAKARPSTLEFVSLDDRLLAAARREGFLTTKPAP